MSNYDEYMEDMDTSETPPSSYNYTQTSACSSQGEEEARITLSVKWSEPDRPQKLKNHLELILQTWFNKRKPGTECSVLKTLKDGSFIIKLKPSPALVELQEMIGQTLTNRYGKTVTILSICLTPPHQETHITDDASMNLPPSSTSKSTDEQITVKQTGFSSAATVSAAGKETCIVPVGHFWYMSHIYKEEIKRIEKINGVKIMTEVKVTFEPDQNSGGDPTKAFSEFTNLVRECIGDSNGSVVPLEFVDPEAWIDTMKIIQKNENKVLVTMTSEEMTICGPSQSQEVISKSINEMHTFLNTYNSPGKSVRTSQDTSLKISMNINDPLAVEGLSIEVRHWDLMSTSFNENIEDIKSKFGVKFNVSDISKDRVNVRALYKGSGGNASMESHAVRALLHLCQKITTSPVMAPFSVEFKTLHRM